MGQGPLTRRMDDSAGVVKKGLIFLMRFGGALALAWLVIEFAAGTFGWRIGKDGITTTAGDLAALRRSVASAELQVDTLAIRVDDIARRGEADRESLRAEVNELRASVIPLLEAQSRFLCFDNRPVADVAGVPCSELGRGRRPPARYQQSP